MIWASGFFKSPLVLRNNKTLGFIGKYVSLKEYIYVWKGFCQMCI